MKRGPDPDLKPMPSDEEIVQAVIEIASREPTYRGATAKQVAERCGHRLGDGPRRHGNGAVKGSYSGHVSPAVRFSATLQRLARLELIEAAYDRDSYRWAYFPVMP